MSRVHVDEVPGSAFRDRQDRIKITIDSPADFGIVYLTPSAALALAHALLAWHNPAPVAPEPEPGAVAE